MIKSPARRGGGKKKQKKARLGCFFFSLADSELLSPARSSRLAGGINPAVSGLDDGQRRTEPELTRRAHSQNKRTTISSIRQNGSGFSAQFAPGSPFSRMNLGAGADANKLHLALAGARHEKGEINKGVKTKKR